MKNDPEYFESDCEETKPKAENDVKIKTEEWVNVNSSVEQGTEEIDETNMSSMNCREEEHKEEMERLKKEHEEEMERLKKEHRDEMESMKKEHKEEMESMKKEHDIETDKMKLAEMVLQAENEKLKKDLKIEAAKVQVAKKEMQVANVKLEKERSKYVEEKMNQARVNEELKKNNESLRKDFNQLTVILASANAVVAKRSSGEDSLPGGSEDELNNQVPPPKRAKYD